MLFILVIFIIILSIFILYVLAITPSIFKPEKIKFFLNYQYAHRGLFSNKKNIPENSMAAFIKAVKKGYAIELDVHITKDGQLIVFHDDTLDRMCGVNINVHASTYDELKGFNLKNSNEHIPLLKDVLDMVNGKVPLLIEIKTDKSNIKMCPELNKLLLTYQGKYLIQSFNPLAIWWYRKNRPDVIRGQLSGGFLDSAGQKGYSYYFMLTYLFFNFLTRPHFISYAHKELNNMSFLINRNIFKVTAFAWTIRNIEDYNKCINNVDTIIFDHFTPPT